MSDGAPIRVCFLIDRWGRGGTETQLLSLIQHLDRARVSPYLVLLRGQDVESRMLAPADCPVWRLGAGGLARPRTLALAWRFARFLRRERIDIVQTYFPDSSYFGVPLARLAGVNCVVRTRFNLGYWMTPLHRWLGRLMTRLATATVTNSEACRQAVIRDEWAGPAGVHLIPNGVDLAALTAIPPLRLPPGKPRRVGLLANLRPVKDPGLFVQAASLVLKQHPDIEFEIGGEGSLWTELEKQIAALNLTRQVRLRGRIDDVPGFVGGLDIAVLCSKSEGSPNAVLEYMAAGRAVVATAVGGTSRLVDDGVHGLLVPPGDAAALADGISRLMEAPPLAERLAAAARQRALERHDPRRRAARHERLYGQLLERPPTAAQPVPEFLGKQAAQAI